MSPCRRGSLATANDLFRVAVSDDEQRRRLARLDHHPVSPAKRPTNRSTDPGMVMRQSASHREGWTRPPPPVEPDAPWRRSRLPVPTGSSIRCRCCCCRWWRQWTATPPEPTRPVEPPAPTAPPVEVAPPLPMNGPLACSYRIALRHLGSVHTHRPARNEPGRAGPIGVHRNAVIRRGTDGTTARHSCPARVCRPCRAAPHSVVTSSMSLTNSRGVDSGDTAWPLPAATTATRLPLGDTAKDRTAARTPAAPFPASVARPISRA